MRLWPVLLLFLIGLFARIEVQWHYPPRDWPDAVPHANYIRYIAQNWAIPTVATPLRENDPTNDYENIQPPLYYFTAAGALAACHAAGFTPLTQFWAVRSLSLLLWSVGFWLLWAACRRFLMPQAAILGAVGLFALLPGWIWISCAVSNDVLLVFWGCLLVYLMSALNPNVWAVCFVLLAACLTKLLAGFLIFLPLVCWFRRREIAKMLAVVGSVVVGLGLMIWRNLTCFGDLTGQSAVAPFYDRPFLHIVKRHVQGFFLSWNQDRALSYEWYLLWPFMLICAVWLCFAVWRVWRSELCHRVKTLALAGFATFVVTVTAIILRGTADGVAPGRLSYVALPALCLLVGAGIQAKRETG